MMNMDEKIESAVDITKRLAEIRRTIGVLLGADYEERAKPYISAIKLGMVTYSCTATKAVGIIAEGMQAKGQDTSLLFAALVDVLREKFRENGMQGLVTAAPKPVYPFVVDDCDE